MEASDSPISSANERLAEQSKLDEMLCTFTETQRDFRQQHWYVVPLSLMENFLLSIYTCTCRKWC